MNKYFEGIKTLEALKKEFFRLAKQFHPDCGGDLEAMKDINNAYEQAFEYIKHFGGLDDKEQFKADYEMAQEFKDMIDKIINLNVNIEIIGNWVWVSGNTFPVKTVLRKAGYDWAAQKKMWFWHPEGYQKRNAKRYDINEIRGMFGAEKVREEEEMKRM